MLLRIVAIWYALLRLLMTIGILRRQQRTNEQPRVSVIIAARNESKLLPDLLAALLAQTYPDYEVIIVDDRSIDQTPEVLQRWQARDARLRSVRVTTEPEQGSPKIHALTQGVAAANGVLLLFTDADCQVPATWIEGLVAYFAPDVGAALGYVDLYAANSTLFEQLQSFDYFAMMALLDGATKLGKPIGASGANMAYRRAAYEQAGGFEGLPAGVIADDMALIQNLLERTSWQVAFCDDRQAHVRSAAEPTIGRFIDQRARWMKGGQNVLGRNVPLLMISVSIGLFNGILLSFPLLLRRRDLQRVLVGALMLRLAVDSLHFSIAAWRFGRTDLLPYMPLWLLIHIPSTIVQPALGVRQSWVWKELPGKD